MKLMTDEELACIEYDAFNLRESKSPKIIAIGEMLRKLLAEIDHLKSELTKAEGENLNLKSSLSL